jgi:hypothetical protein
VWHVYLERQQRVARVLAVGLAFIGLIAGLAAAITDSSYALKILVMSSIVTWGASCFSHT